MTAAIRLSEDRLTAWIDLPAGGGCDIAQLRELIAGAGIRHGLQREILVEAGKAAPEARSLVVARGDPPVPGAPGRVEVLVDVHDQPLKDDTGTLDIHHQHRIADVEAGQALARALPPTLGKPGRTVDGQDIPAPPGEPADLGSWCGDGVARDAGSITAAAAGVCRCTLAAKSLILSVSPKLVLRGDVDRSIGDIETRFDIEVGGDIKAGFTVKSGGSISVRGAIEDTRVSARAGLQVGGILAGANRVKAIGDIIARHIEEREVKCRSLAVANSLIAARVFALGHVAARDIIGGQVMCAGSVVCDNLGDSLGTPTVIHVGVNPYEQALYAAASKARDQALFTLQEVEERCRNLTAKVQQGALLHRSDIGLIAAELRRQLAERDRFKAEVASCDQVMAQHAERLKALRTLVDRARVAVGKMLMPGVTVVFGGETTFVVKEPMKGTVLTCRDGVVAV